MFALWYLPQSHSIPLLVALLVRQKDYLAIYRSLLIRQSSEGSKAPLLSQKIDFLIITIRIIFESKYTI